MGLQTLEVRGFRSLRNIRWKPGRLNVLIGPNGSGKSNLLQALDCLQKAAAGDLPDEIVRQGGIGPILWDEREHRISWIARTDKPDIIYDLELQRLGQTSSYRIDNERLEKGGIALLSRQSEAAMYKTHEGGQRKTPPKFVKEDQTALSRVALPILIDAEAALFREQLASWKIYQNFRLDKESPIRRAALTRYDKHIEIDGQNLISVLHTLYSEDRFFMQAVDKAMFAAFGREYEGLFFSPAADQHIQLRLGWRSLKMKQPSASLSDGTLRFLLLIAILANPEPGDLIAIDEPETGLHPSMFPIIAELAAEATERTQVIFTTHSPQFLDAFRDQPPTTTVAEWVDGETRLSVLDGDELQRWLKEYSLGSLFRSGQLEAMA